MSDDKCDGQNKITVSIINQDKVNGLTEEYNKITGDEPANNAERYNLIKQVSANMEICNENVQGIDAKSSEMSETHPETGTGDVELQPEMSETNPETGTGTGDIGMQPEMHENYPETGTGKVKMQLNPLFKNNKTTKPGGTFRRKNKRKGNKSAKKQKKTKRRYNKK
jgi:hypothetical protein